MSYAFNIPLKVEKTDPEEEMYKELLTSIISRQSVDTIEIPGVTAVGQYALYRWTSNFPNSIIMPDVVYVYQFAFSDFRGNGKISLPKCVEFVGTATIQNAINVTEIYAPLCAKFGSHFCYSANYLASVTLGTITEGGDSSFSYAGRYAPIGQDGRTRLVIKVGNSMDSLMAVTGFPWGASSTSTTNGFVKWVCSDGYITLDDGVWTKHAN